MGRRRGSLRQDTRVDGVAALVALGLATALAPQAARADRGALTVEAALESSLSREAPLLPGYRPGTRLGIGGTLELRWAFHHRVEAGVFLGRDGRALARYQRRDDREDGFPVLAEPSSADRAGLAGRLYLSGRVRRLFVAGSLGAAWRRGEPPLGLLDEAPDPVWTPLVIAPDRRRVPLASLGLGLERVGDRSAAGLRVDAGLAGLEPRLSARVYLAWFFYP